ncbi:MAG: type I glyceraldehyde-3-phosphate dehydrogenase [Magnetococcales bacterium]|nr:type I glyceraldehyde-3-phosphate dehydrogenase [Magnetococcales bacterium]
MTIKIGINGFGRIGRAVFRAITTNQAYENIEVVAINDLTPCTTLAHLLKYDSVMGGWQKKVEATQNGLLIDGKEVVVSHESDPGQIPWKKFGASYVVESTGRFAAADKAAAHMKGGAERVIITAPAKGEVRTIVMGVNEDSYDPNVDKIVSNASCTTNCLAPVAQVIMERFGIVSGMMTTVHSYTGDQRLTDQPHKDLRRARAAALSMIPTHTGAATAIGLVIPELQGRFSGLSVRVPTPNVSLVDAVMVVETPCTVAEVNSALKESSNQYLDYSDEPLVSIDYLGNPYSSIVDSISTLVVGNQIKVLSWYDNEWGYANRVLDLINHMQSQETL